MSTNTPAKPNNAPASTEPANPTVTVAKLVSQYLQNDQMVLPKDYSPENALKHAWIALQSISNLKNLDKASVINSLFDMTIQGLNPNKKQCYFIPYGTTLTMQRSYFGDQALAERLMPGIEVVSQVVYEGDEFEYEIRRGRKVVVLHKQSIDNREPDKIKAAYTEVYDSNGESLGAEIMTIDEIHQSWKKSKTYKPNGASFHTEQPDQACMRTTLRRRMKPIINNSSDMELLKSIRREEIAANSADADEIARAYGNAEVLALPAQEAPITAEVVEHDAPQAEAATAPNVEPTQAKADF